MLKIKFRYADKYSDWKWKNQECVCSNVSECVKFYGLGNECTYEFTSIEDEFYKVYKIGDAYVVDSNHYGTCEVFNNLDEVLLWLKDKEEK